MILDVQRSETVFGSGCDDLMHGRGDAVKSVPRRISVVSWFVVSIQV